MFIYFYMGLYVFANRIVALPAALFTRSIADVFHARVATESKSDRDVIFKIFNSATKWLIGIAIVPAIIAILIFPKIFGYIFSRIVQAIPLYRLAMFICLSTYFVKMSCLRKISAIKRGKILNLSLKVINKKFYLSYDNFDIDIDFDNL